MARPAASTGWTVRAELPTEFELDPARTYGDPPDTLLHYATCLKLVNYRHGSGPRTTTLVPEAAPWPKVSKDGRTYTFRIRADFTRFSNGRPVTAENFERAIERASVSYSAREYVRDILGARDGERGARRIRGVRARGHELVLRLERPAADLLTRLSLPFFCAVPRNLRVSRPTAPIPSAGPYYVASWQPRESVVLERNRYYRGPRPHRPARVIFTTAYPVERSFERVKSGEIDWLLEGFVPNERSRSSWGARSPTMEVRWLAFNTRAGPFRSVRLRRAVAHALDRTAVANASGVAWGAAADQLSPPQVPGRITRPVFSPAGGDAGLARARQLAAGLVPVKARLFASWRSLGGGAQAAVIKDRLALIGIEVDFFFACPIECTPEHFDLALDGVWLPYPDPALTLRELVMPAGGSIFSLYDPRMRTPPPVWKRRLERAGRLPVRQRLRELRRLERRLATDVVPATGLFTRNYISFFSQRVGCRGPHWIYQVDIAALCLRR